MKYFLLVVLYGAISFSCSTGNSQTGFMAVNSSEKIQPAANQKIKSDVVKNDTPKVKGLYIAEPKDDGNLIIPGNSLISIFYENGDFGRLDLGLQKKKDSKTEIFGFFDEVVEFGNWKEENGQIKITIQNCRCDHCDEDHGEKMTKAQVQNPVPFTEIWKIERGNLGEPENTIVKEKKKYLLIKDKEYKFMNYEAMIAEPLKVKNYNSDRKCIAFDLDGYNK